MESGAGDLFGMWGEPDAVASDPDEKVLMRLTVAARDNGDPVACLRLARKTTASGDVARAIALYQYALQLASGTPNSVTDLVRLNCQFHLAVAYYDDLTGPDTRSNTEKGVALIREIVARGVPDIPPDDVPVMTELQALDEVQSHEEVIRSSCFNLGVAHLTGIGTIKSEAMALGWFQKGSNFGCQQSMNALGRHYAGGGNIDPISLDATPFVDRKLALRWHLAAAEAGNPDSMSAAGTIYGHQLVANQDSALALQWLKCGANCGSLAGQASLVMLYFRLHFYNKCVQWATRIVESVSTAERGATDPTDAPLQAVGCYILGRCHELGRGVPSSRDTAEQLYRQAAKLDVDIVKRLHGKL